MTTAPPHPATAAALATPPWHLAGSLQALLNAVNAHWPNRDKRSDGGIGDAAHAAQGSASDHNPWLNNTVRAFDFTATQPGISGIDGDWFAEQLRAAGAAGDHRLVGHTGNLDDNGYVIWNHHITAPDWSRWVAYDGDPHTSHVHVSVCRVANGYEDPGPWGFLQAAPIHPPTPTPAPPPGHLAPEPAPVHPAPAGQPAAVAGPHDGNTAPEAPAPVGDFDGPEPGNDYAPRGADAIGSGAGYRAQWGNTGPRVKQLQEELNRVFPEYSHLPVTGLYGDETTAVIEDFARRVAASPSCPPEDRDALNAANGDNVGPHIAAELARYGVQV